MGTFSPKSSMSCNLVSERNVSQRRSFFFILPLKKTSFRIQSIEAPMTPSRPKSSPVQLICNATRSTRYAVRDLPPYPGSKKLLHHPLKANPLVRSRRTRSRHYKAPEKSGLGEAWRSLTIRGLTSNRVARTPRCLRNTRRVCAADLVSCTRQGFRWIFFLPPCWFSFFSLHPLVTFALDRVSFFIRAPERIHGTRWQNIRAVYIRFKRQFSAACALIYKITEPTYAKLKISLPFLVK